MTFMTYLGHVFLLLYVQEFTKNFFFLFCQDFISTVSVCLYQITLRMYHLLLLFYLMINLVFITQIGSFFLEPLSLQSMLLYLVLLILNLVIDRELV